MPCINSRTGTMRSARQTYARSFLYAVLLFFYPVWFALSTARTSAPARTNLSPRYVLHRFHALWPRVRVSEERLSRVRWWNDKALPEEKAPRRKIQFYSRSPRETAFELLRILGMRYFKYRVRISLALVHNFIWNIDLRFSNIIPVFVTEYWLKNH